MDFDDILTMFLEKLSSDDEFRNKMNRMFQ